VTARPALAIALTGSALLLVACGTRLPDSSFGPAGGGRAAGSSGGAGPVAAGAGADAGTAGSTADGGAGSGGSGGGSGGRSGGGSAHGSAAGGTAGGATGSSGTGHSSHGTTGPRNTASDVGVTPTTIRLGTIASRTNPFDPTAFVGPTYGVEAFVADINRRGGIAGRKLQLVSCDDHADGSHNNSCVHQLIDNDKVFALVSNAIFSYAGASYVQSKGVPDVGSQPIDTAYDQYSHLWDLYGESYPRNGTVGYDGKLEGGTEVYHYFKTAFPKVPLKAGVVYYNEADSQRYADNLNRGLKAEGYTVVDKEVNFALPDYDSAVLDMKAQGVRYVYDVLDAGGNQNLCASMDANGLSAQVQAKVTTTQSWTAAIRSQYDQSPQCRNKIWATGNTRNYEDTQYAPVRAFRAAMARQHTDGPEQLSEWALEGWAGAQWLADAMASCGADLTRGCVEKYVGRSQPYDGHGLLTPRSFEKHPHRAKTHNCLNVARWQDSAQHGKGGWVTQVADMDKTCYDVPTVLYSP
jgi:branched-chain amino acid transport system substrate-binding protein